MKRKTIYVLADEDRVIRYLGSTDLTCEERFKEEAASCWWQAKAQHSAATTSTTIITTATTAIDAGQLQRLSETAIQR